MRAFTLVEVLIAALVLALVAIPLFSLLTVQKHQLTWASRETLVTAYAVDRLAEEEARLTVLGFRPRARASRPVELLQATEALEVSSSPDLGSLFKISLTLSWKDEPSGTPRELSLYKLVVDRDAASRAVLVRPAWEAQP